MIDQELDNLALQLATTMVDEEISKHPEFAPNRDRLLLNKTSLLKNELLEDNNLLLKDLKRASVLIDEYQLMSDLSLNN